MQKTLVLISSAIRATQIETWANSYGRDGEPYVDAHFPANRNIG